MKTTTIAFRTQILALEKRFIMQQLRVARLRSAVLILTIGFAPSLTLTGCSSGDGGTEVEQAKVGHEAAKSSMEYMRKRHAELQGGPKTQSRQAPKGP
jgi:hypothetical protein